MPRRRRLQPDPRLEAGRLLEAGKPRLAADVYRKAMRRGWKPLTADEELLLLSLFTSA